MTLEKIEYGDEGGKLPGWIGGPKGKAAVIVMQEWWGITDEIKRQAEYISEKQGVRVLVPDIYKGKLGVTGEEAHHLMENLDWPNAIKEIVTAERFLRHEGSPKVATVGFCMGGALSLLAAEHGSVDGSISFYGTPDAKLSHPEKIKAPIQAHSGSEDKFAGFADPATVKAWLARLPGSSEFWEYPGEGHAFMNSSEGIKELMGKAGLPTDMKKESQDKAWERTFAFFDKVLA
jgi:carboxymethylenebutenolidase